MTEEKFSDVEKAIIKLTIVQEVQTKQSDIQSKQMDALLENSTVTKVVAESIKEHNIQLIDLYTKINAAAREQRQNKEDLIEKITNARTSLNRASYGRLVLALTVATGITWKLFSLNKEDIDDIMTTKTKVLQRITLIENDVDHLHTHLELTKNKKIGPRK